MAILEVHWFIEVDQKVLIIKLVWSVLVQVNVDQDLLEFTLKYLLLWIGSVRIWNHKIKRIKNNFFGFWLKYCVQVHTYHLFRYSMDYFLLQINFFGQKSLKSFFLLETTRIRNKEEHVAFVHLKIKSSIAQHLLVIITQPLKSKLTWFRWWA